MSEMSEKAQLKDLLHFQNTLIEAAEMPEDITPDQVLPWFIKRLSDEQLPEWVEYADTRDIVANILDLRAELEKVRGESTGWCKRAIVAEKERDSARAEERALRARIERELGQ